MNIKHVSSCIKTCQNYLRDLTSVLTCRCEHTDSLPAIPIAQIDASHDQACLENEAIIGYDKNHHGNRCHGFCQPSFEFGGIKI